MRKGQVAIYLAMTLVVIVVLAVMNVSVYVAVRDKNRAQNAGDAAALAVAAEQGRLINEIGRLNLAHLRAQTPMEVAEIVERQRRLCLLGPVEAMQLAQDAARQEGASENDDYGELLNEHWNYAIQEYTKGDPYHEPYPGAWGEYIDAMSAQGAKKLYAYADNAEFYGIGAGHWLTTKSFYKAINGEDWCWFYFYCEYLLQNYRSYADWPALPGGDSYDTNNSEFFPLHLEVRKCAISSVYNRQELSEIEKNYNENLVDDQEQYWFFFRDDFRLPWNKLKDGFPAVGPVRDDRDYYGCSAVVRVKSGESEWTAAAKPFGDVDENGLVLPAFTSARLIPIDAATAGERCTADREWVCHLRDHLDKYLDNGVSGLKPQCGYCAALRTWEHDSFRFRGRLWLRQYKNTCRRSFGGGLSGQGGAVGH
ncbi:MAG: hypothetical protein J6P80_03850 [Kiritimatiellae bacterium]|nr:hypothetical protein [Kiritimatiellia bacterium]